MNEMMNVQTMEMVQTSIFKQSSSQSSREPLQKFCDLGSPMPAQSHQNQLSKVFQRFLKQVSENCFYSQGWQEKMLVQSGSLKPSQNTKIQVESRPSDTGPSMGSPVSSPVVLLLEPLGFCRKNSFYRASIKQLYILYLTSD